MKKKAIYSIGIVLGLAAALIMVTAAKIQTTSSESKACKETMQDCCKNEKDSDTNGNIDFESLPGKFFSSVLIN
ncbi:MAG: hypothetical protein ABUT20_42425 [Bacteroidota bacterium]